MASYASASDVAARTPMLLQGKDIFTETTEPSLRQVESFIQEIASDMHVTFYAVGYSGSASEDTELFPTFRMVNALGAAALAEITRITDVIDARERSRGQVLWKMYEMQRDRLANMDLSQAGFGLDQPGPYFGGQSVSDKEEDESDTDVVQPRFSRGKFRHPGAGFPHTSASGERDF